ncbi:Virk protein (modular protein) [Paraburkholderia piptadeniae]|uniref:VirK protein n=2 Tax=Paraburkholderia TaxID=1822464 RepID=A0A7X1NKP5_9BURK|nr:MULTISPECIES: VirK family protein [Paraburkholderia]MPW23649.1 hypothetical protein [Paraburkholderia franconis]SIT51977.1 Virk protein (modular protein) [Paraburkholderia piptadeniae]
MQTFLIAPLIAAPMISGHAEPAKQLPSLADVESALNRGAAVSVAADLTKCSPAGDTTSQSGTRGGVKINAYWTMADGTLSFSDEHATVDLVGAPTFQDPFGAPIWQSIRYTVKPDQTVFVATKLFFLPSYNPMMHVDYACAINQGIAYYTEGLKCDYQPTTRCELGPLRLNSAGPADFFCNGDRDDRPL